MRDRRVDRFIVLPLSVGCVSQSSVAVCENQPSEVGVRQSTAKLKNSFGAHSFPSRPNISAGFQKLIKSFKSMYKDDDAEVEMEIGFPTDVQHVVHIGWDGLSSSMSTKKKKKKRKSWDEAATPPEFLSHPSYSLKQLELAMAANEAGAHPPHGPHGSWPQ